MSDQREDHSEAVRQLHEEADPVFRGEEREVVIRLRRKRNGEVGVWSYSAEEETRSDS